uniref:N-acyl-aromatic-L-amino acid amidohydrolase (carboxylate-forming) n=1 Tax=Jaculus jaculus TaxID=51337 RepID=UPI001E1B42BB|nr:N-acyl-aromatic-L-amino acid amidohydrolase (carboxylate-forming) [Jaculus jaculus]
MCALPTPWEPLRRVAVTGGTHGNELGGVYLVRHWLQAPGELQRPSFSATPILANPAATAVCRRYVDQDLNRTFTNTFLTSKATPDDPYEVTRAQELNQQLGPKGSDQAFDFILDLHNTTANMGTSFILEATRNLFPEATFSMHLCRYLQLQSPELTYSILEYQAPGETNGLPSVAKNGICLEMGPQPQGVLRADIFSRMRALVASTLDFIELFNRGTAFPAFDVEVYRILDSVDFPRTEDGHLAGTVHPQLQDRDFEPLLPGAPIFKLFNGKDVLYDGDSTVYPVFINEAAYYEKSVAFLKSRKLTVSVPALPALTAAPTLAP